MKIQFRLQGGDGASGATGESGKNSYDSTRASKGTCYSEGGKCSSSIGYLGKHSTNGKDGENGGEGGNGGNAGRAIIIFNTTDSNICTEFHVDGGSGGQGGLGELRGKHGKVIANEEYNSSCNLYLIPLGFISLPICIKRRTGDKRPLLQDRNMRKPGRNGLHGNRGSFFRTSFLQSLHSVPETSLIQFASLLEKYCDDNMLLPQSASEFLIGTLQFVEAIRPSRNSSGLLSNIGRRASIKMKQLQAQSGFPLPLSMS